EGDLTRLRVDERGDRLARRLQTGLELPIGEQVGRGAFGGELVEGAAGALGDGADGGVVQVDGVGGPGKLGGAERAERVAQRAQTGRVIGDVGHGLTRWASSSPTLKRGLGGALC